MKILVTVKRVIDPYIKIRVRPDHSGVDLQNTKMAMNPFDEIAVEEALRLREKGLACEIVVLSIGSDASQETIRHALALGADRGILVKADQNLCSLNIAKIIRKIVLDESPDLILMGKQSIDGDNNQTPQMLAALLNWPQATFASQLSITDKKIHVTRETDGGLESLELNMPAVISTDLRLNEPRYASLPNIMKSKQKPLAFIDLASLGLELKPHIEILKVTPPTLKTAGVKIDSVDELIEKLKNEVNVL